MARTVPEQELQAIEAVVLAAPEGMTLDQIEAALALTLSQRTLQRRLKHLVVNERLRMEGERRWARYRARTGPTC